MSSSFIRFNFFKMGSTCALYLLYDIMRTALFCTVNLLFCNLFALLTFIIC